MNNDILNALLNLSNDHLLMMIANDVSVDSNNFSTPSVDDLMATAERWLNSVEKDLQSAICENDKIVRILSTEDQLSLLAAVADLITSICIGVSPFTVAALLVRRGINVLCADNLVFNKMKL